MGARVEDLNEVLLDYLVEQSEPRSIDKINADALSRRAAAGIDA